jgi:hypothetical protein
LRHAYRFHAWDHVRGWSGFIGLRFCCGYVAGLGFFADAVAVDDFIRADEISRGFERSAVDELGFLSREKQGYCEEGAH